MRPLPATPPTPTPTPRMRTDTRRRRLLGAAGGAAALAWLAPRGAGALVALGAGAQALFGAGAQAALAAQPAAPGQPVNWPEVALLDGPHRSAEDWQGRAAVIVFFSTDCPYCRRHNRHVNRLVEAARGHALQVLGVAQDRDPDRVRRHIAAEGLRFPVTLASDALHAALSLRRVIPLTCVTDRQGRLREVIPGEMFEEDVMGLVRWAQA